ncbi:conserved hypothetical protein [Aeropyrum pernix K1]|uniref:Vitamin K epoxide reductase domain-containing protein n=1 Tax=Aeropyrum pernix (strain ATCC 700893 / DSM 11879 / JCM 9820 / NBRC 100138 / K1) TaxID=272557 RepID=Q9Y922_AERPE|nr:vitamin K epoxide reductase family protein [Aeropyrum pernix]BAA81478.2 conserved hypothetical protein [Aeropyrum pernix K1]
MSRLSHALLAVTLVGYAASIAGYFEYVSGSGVCEIGDVGFAVVNCSSVYDIPEAVVFGVVHLSVLAPVYFTLLSLVALAYWIRRSRIFLIASSFLSLVGVVTVPYLVYLELFVAGAVCLWCTVMHISILLAFALAIVGLRIGGHT